MHNLVARPSSTSLPCTPLRRSLPRRVSAPSSRVLVPTFSVVLLVLVSCPSMTKFSLSCSARSSLVVLVKFLQLDDNRSFLVRREQNINFDKVLGQGIQSNTTNRCNLYRVVLRVFGRNKIRVSFVVTCGTFTILECVLYELKSVYSSACASAGTCWKYRIEVSRIWIIAFQIHSPLPQHIVHSESFMRFVVPVKYLTTSIFSERSL